MQSHSLIIMSRVTGRNRCYTNLPLHCAVLDKTASKLEVKQNENYLSVYVGDVNDESVMTCDRKLHLFDFFFRQIFNIKAFFL